MRERMIRYRNREKEKENTKSVCRREGQEGLYQYSLKTCYSEILFILKETHLLCGALIFKQVGPFVNKT